MIGATSGLKNGSQDESSSGEDPEGRHHESARDPDSDDVLSVLYRIDII